MDCELINPVNLGSEDNPDYEFSGLTCIASTSTTSTPYEFIEKQNDDFYLSKTLNYGDIIVIGFLIPIILTVIVIVIRDFLKKKYAGR